MATKLNDRILVTVFTGRLQIFIGRGDVHVFDIVQGDEDRSIKFTFTDQDGNAIDLSNSPGGRCTLTHKKDGQRIFDAQDMASGASSGNIQYDWGSGDLDQPGLYDLEVELTEDGTNYYTVPELIEVRIRRRRASS